MNSLQRAHRQQRLTPRRRRIGLLVTTIALVPWALFAVNQCTKTEIDLPLADIATRDAVQSHVSAESRNPFSWSELLMLPAEQDSRRGWSK